MQQWPCGEKWQPWMKKLDALLPAFAERAEHYDESGQVPVHNFADLNAHGFLQLTVPEQYGGQAIPLVPMLQIVEKIAQADASTALGLGWHLGVMLNLRETRPWKEETFARVCTDVVRQGALINVCATEPATGSPSRGGRPSTTAVRETDGWTLNGRKTWSTLSPLLQYYIVTASVSGSERVAEFLIDRGTPGLSVQETWDSMSMRATGSHDVLLENVSLGTEALLEERAMDERSLKSKDGSGWLLHIPACYLGIAAAASNDALQFAQTYRPNTLSAPIAELPAVQEKIGRIHVQLYTCRTLLYHTAHMWDTYPQERVVQRAERSAAKYVVTNQAIEIVDMAMRIMGGHSLRREHRLHRYYRDVRAGLHHPPMDDITLRLMGQKALQHTQTLN